VDDPWVERVRAAVTAERGAAPVIGVPYGADMRLFTARGIPTVMVGTNDLELAHAVDESVSLSELEALARVIVRVLAPANVNGEH
jgi:acetylornithine deacetylase